MKPEQRQRQQQRNSSRHKETATRRPEFASKISTEREKHKIVFLRPCSTLQKSSFCELRETTKNQPSGLKTVKRENL